MTVTVTREEIASCRCKLSIQVDVATVNQAREGIVRDIRKRATLPGFRKGKAPRKMIERDYADSIQTELTQRVVTEAYYAALEQEHIHPLSDPEFDDFTLEDQKPLSFTATLDVRPEIELGEYKGLELTRPPGEVTDAEVEEVLSTLQERHAQFESLADHKAAIGDLMVVDFVCAIDGEPFEGGTAEGYTHMLGDGRLLPEFDEHLQGCAAGEEIDFPMTFPADYHGKEVAGKTADVHVTVKEVKLKKLMPLDDEFAKDVGDCETLDALREKIREDVQRHKVAQAERGLRDQAMERLLESSHVDVPARLHERARQRIIQEAEHRMRQQGATDEQMAEYRDAMAQQASERATRQIKSSFLLDTLAHAESLHASEEDVKARLDALARQPQVDAKALRQHFSNPDHRADLRREIEVDKVLDFLVAQATITTAAPEAAAEESE